MSPLFLDTGYIIALEAVDDQHHDSARRHWLQLVKRLPPLVTTSYVFDEVVTFFNSKGRHAKALEIGRRLLRSPSIRLIRVDSVLFDEAWLYFQDRPDKRYSFTDCVSFLVMERERIPEALAFDGHFEQAGFRRLP